MFKVFPHIFQADMMECGSTCLAIVFKSYGYRDVRQFLSQQMQVSTDGTDLLAVAELAEKYGFDANGYQLEIDELEQLHFPCIAHVDGNHFVVLYKMDRSFVYVSDPAVGLYSMSLDDFYDRWTGVVLELKPTKDIFKNDELKQLEKNWAKRRKSIWSAYYKSSLKLDRKTLVNLIVTSLVIAVFSLVLPLFTQVIVDEVLTNNNVNLLFVILAAIVFVVIAQVAITYNRNLVLSQIKVEFEHKFFSRFFSHLIRLEKSYFNRHRKEDFINRFNENTKFREILNPIVVESLIDIVFLPLMLGALFYFNITLALVVTAFLSLYVVYAFMTTRKIRFIESEIFETTEQSLGRFIDYVIGIDTLKLLGIERLGHWRWKNSYTRSLNKVLKSEKWYIKINTITSTIFFVCQAVVLWYGSFLVFNNQMTLGSYVAFITLFEIVSATALNFRQQWLFFADISVSINKINDILSEPVERQGNTPLKYYNEDKSLNIQVRELTFSYHKSQSAPTIDGINLNIAAGKRIGLVGRNGSGKSTFVHLLAGFYREYQGGIFINGLELRRFRKQELRERIYMVQQDVYLFEGTLKQNLRYANPNATDQQILSAVSRADLMGFVEKNYLGLNTTIGSGGTNLSGGEKLKVAFARLFLRKPSVIILDEASSALDQEAERLLLTEVERSFPNSTIISIAHRLNTLKNADRILVMHQGKIAEKGSHKQLMTKRGIYHTLLKSYVGA